MVEATSVVDAQRFTLWVDADGCPREVKDRVARASRQRGFWVILVANRVTAFGGTPWYECRTVAGTFDAADHYLVEQARPGHLVLTSDIPLAHALVQRQVVTISPSTGEQFEPETVGQRLGLRNLNAELRSDGLKTRPPTPAEIARCRNLFAQSLDRALTRCLRQAERA